MGGRAGVRVYTTEIFYDTSRTPIDWGLASAYSMALVAVAVVLLLVYFRLVRHGERYQTITGKDFRPRRIDLGGWRYLTCAISLLLVLLITGVPFLMMVYASLLPFYQAPTAAAFESMSFANYWALFHNAKTVAADDQQHDPRPGGGDRGRIRGRHDRLFRAEDAAARPPHPRLPRLRADRHSERRARRDLLLVLPAGAAADHRHARDHRARLPHQIHAGGAALRLGLDDADPQRARRGRAGRRRALVENFFKVMLPLLKPGLLAAWFWVMVHAYRELTVALMLARSQNRTAAVVIFDLWEEGSFLLLTAFGVLMFLVLMALSSIAYLISRRFGVQEQI